MLIGLTGEHMGKSVGKAGGSVPVCGGESVGGTVCGKMSESIASFSPPCAASVVGRARGRCV